MCCCTPAAPWPRAGTEPAAWPSPARCPPPCPGPSAKRWPPGPPGSSPRAGSPRTTWHGTGWASGAPRWPASCFPASSPCCGRRMPGPRRSAWRTWGAPRTSARAARAGQVVRGYDVMPGRAAFLAADGVRPVDTVAAAVGGADLIVIMVATPEQVEQALFAPGGAASALAAGSIVVVMATVGPEAVISAADRLAAGGVAVVDAPVSGGTARAATGDLLIMVSGPEEPVARAQPVLSALARSAPVVGSSPGDGQRMKLVNQLLCGVHIAAAAEALAFAEALGLTAAECWRVLREGAAASFMLEDRGARMVEGQFEPARSALDIFVKDMGLVGAAAEQAGAAAPLAAAARRLYVRGH